MSGSARATVFQRDGRWLGTLGAFTTEASTRGRCIAALRRAAGTDASFVVEVVPELVGVTEAAALLGWDRRRVATYIERGTFPEPLAHLASGRVWRRADVESFMAARRKSRGKGGAR